MKTQNSHCPTCNKPYENKSGGLLTELIGVCGCNSSIDESNSSWCMNCRKTISNSREGTLTHYIFQYVRCSCDNPQPVPERSVESEVSFDEHLEELENEIELEMDPARFPVERYKALALVGKGASGKVYLSRDRFLSTKVAVKILHELSKEQLINFQNEAKVISKLSHSNIIQILDFGISPESTPYMVLEYASGINLEDLLKKEKVLDTTTSIAIVKEIAKGLEYAHQQGIFHHDLKPTNIILNMSDSAGLQVKIIDFGVAIVKETSGPIIEYEGHNLVGTPCYMAPDLALNHEYTAVSEIYSLGCLFYEMLSGNPPFEADTALKTLFLHANEPVPDFEGVPKEVKSILFKCLKKDPAERPQSMSEMIEQLNLFLTEESKQEHFVDENASYQHSPRRLKLLKYKYLILICLCLLSVISFRFLGSSIFEKKKTPEPAKKNKITVTPQPSAESDAMELSMASNLSDKAFEHMERKEYKKAEELYLQALKIKESIVGKNDKGLVPELMGLGLVAIVNKNEEEAVRLFKRNIELCQKGPDINVTDLSLCMKNLAMLYTKQKRYDEAEKLLIRIIELNQNEPNPDYFTICEGMRNLGVVYENQKHYDESILWLKRSISLSRKKLGRTHGFTVQTMIELHAILKECGKKSEALKMEKQLNEIIQQRQEHSR